MDYHQFLKKLGAAVRQKRLDNKKSQEAVAHDLGVHQSNVSKLEKGAQGFDSKTLFDLGQSLGTPLHQLLKTVEASEPMDQRFELLSDAERDIVRLFRSCNARGREILMSVAEMTAKANPQGANVVPITRPRKRERGAAARKAR
jgi:transcriptional regulator with XRE-family HTH domain